MKATSPGRRVIENWSCLNESTPVDLIDFFSSSWIGSACILVHTIDPVVVAMCCHIHRPMPHPYPFITSSFLFTSRNISQSVEVHLDTSLRSGRDPYKNSHRSF